MAVPSTPCWLVISANNHKSARILHGCGLFVSCGKILANGFKLQGTVLFLSKNGLIHGLIPVWMLTIHLLVFCFVKLRENLFLNLPKSRVPTPFFNRLNEVVIAFSESIGIWLVPSLASLGVTSILRAINRFDWTISRG